MGKGVNLTLALNIIKIYNIMLYCIYSCYFKLMDFVNLDYYILINCKYELCLKRFKIQ